MLVYFLLTECFNEEERFVFLCSDEGTQANNKGCASLTCGFQGCSRHPANIRRVENGVGGF